MLMQNKLWQQETSKDNRASSKEPFSLRSLATLNVYSIPGKDKVQLSWHSLGVLT